MDFTSGIELADQRQQRELIYRRRKPNDPTQNVDPSKKLSLSLVPVAVAPSKKTSWTRSLSTRGRTSVAVGACFEYRPQLKEPKRKGKPKGKAPAPLPKGKYNYEKEKAYFQEVDGFDLIEESPSPKPTTWVAGIQTDTVALPKLCSPLGKLLSRKLNFTFEPSSTLSKMIQTSTMRPMPSERIGGRNLRYSSSTIPQNSIEVNYRLPSAQSEFALSLHDTSVLERRNIESMLDVGNEDLEDIEASVKNLSLASSSFDSEQLDAFGALLAVCGQSATLQLRDVFSTYCDLEEINKVGEGTYGEVLRAGKYACKIVPFDGNLQVNGENQKKSEELLEEVVLSRTLNCLRGNDGNAQNACTMFVGTVDSWVCQGSYDDALTKAWEDWDEKRGSENDHPKAFPDLQCYVVFVLEHGGEDLESFVLLNIHEARSLLVQVTAALAVAEAAYEFEHRDLHWGNILLSRNGSAIMQFTLKGKKMFIQTFGLVISIIDFTLSRINTGDDILFLDLSNDPEIFQGPKGDRQSETYRRMKEVTEDCWERSFPRTNVLWLLYLVDILLLKKSFERSSKDERDLRSLKKRLDKCQSAREALLDPSFTDLLVDHAII